MYTIKYIDFKYIYNKAKYGVFKKKLKFNKVEYDFCNQHHTANCLRVICDHKKGHKQRLKVTLFGGFEAVLVSL